MRPSHRKETKPKDMFIVGPAGTDDSKQLQKHVPCARYKAIQSNKKSNLSIQPQSNTKSPALSNDPATKDQKQTPLKKKMLLVLSKESARSFLPHIQDQNLLNPFTNPLTSPAQKPRALLLNASHRASKKHRPIDVMMPVVAAAAPLPLPPPLSSLRQ